MSRTASRKFAGRVVVKHLIYDLLWVFAILVTSPYIIYRILTRQRFRAGLIQRLGFVPKRRSEEQAVWIHGVSAGEIKTILPLLKRIEQSYPEVEFAISTTTLAGYQMAQRLFPGRFIFYFPLDIGFIVRKVVRRIDPALVILMELEIWPNLLYEADRWGAPIVIVNGRISEKSFKGYRLGKKLLPEMDRIILFSVQSKEYQDRLLALEIPQEKIKITGNIKYDGIDTSEVLDARVIKSNLKLTETNRVLVAGSTHGGEEEILLDVYLALIKDHPELRLILAPRHIERVDDIEKVCARRNLVPVRRTVIMKKREIVDHKEILILDTIGELDRVYAAADLVFVGGSLVPVGGHNIMEPAGKGKPVVYGPYMFNFSEDAALLERHRAAGKVASQEELQDWVDRLLKDEEEAQRYEKAAREAISSAKGATERNFDLIDRIFLKTLRENER